jgi:murein L,D-transpeptidase YcbB/YkuD
MEELANYEERSWNDQIRLLTDEDVINIVKEYCDIASLKSLSKHHEDRMVEILEMAEGNGALDFWLNEADHFMDHELNLETGQTLYPVDTERLMIKIKRELQNSSQKSPNIREYADETGIDDFFKSGAQEGKNLQESLKDRGLYQGPIDGLIGHRTKKAIKDFQKENNLVPDGKIDNLTLLVLRQK